MDEIGYAFFETRFELAFRGKKGDAFQDFFSTIMEKAHPSDFIRSRPWGKTGDRKNDGYLKSQRTLFQVYAPNDLSAREAIAKIDEDFVGALRYWEEYFDVWVFVHNSTSGLGPDVIKKLLELDEKHEPEVRHWGYEKLREKALLLPHDQLVSLLGPIPSRRAVVNLGLDCLTPILDQLATLPAPPDPDLRPPPADKIARNALSAHVEVLLKAGMTRADLVRKYFRAQPARQDEVAASFRRRYDDARSRGLAPDAIFTDLQRFAGGDELASVAHQSGVLAVLSYFFEECDIFERADEQSP